MFNKKNKRLLLFLSLANVVVLVLWALLFFLLLNEAELVAQKNRNLVNLEEGRRTGLALENLFNQTMSGRDLVSTYFYTSDDIIPLVEIIESKARISGVSLNLSNVEVGGTLKFSMRAEANEVNLREFLSSLELAPFVFRFNRFNWERSASALAGEGIGLVVMQAEIEILSFQE